jgi:hypothetical protein
MNGETTGGLTDRHHLNPVDVDVRRTQKSPYNGVGDGARVKRLNPSIDFLLFFHIAFKADKRKLCPADHPGLYVGDANGSSQQIRP